MLKGTRLLAKKNVFIPALVFIAFRKACTHHIYVCMYICMQYMKRCANIGYICS